MRLGVLSLAILLGAPAVARADHPPDDPCASSCGQPGFTRRAALTGDWGGLRTSLEDSGVELNGSYAAEVFAAPALDREVVGLGVAGLSIDVDLATLVDDGLGGIHVLGFAIHGDGLSSELMDIHGVSNNVADEDVRLFEAWIEQPIGPASVRAGLLSADQEFVIADHGTVLLDATFGVIGQVSANVIGPVYPVATPGVSTSVDAGPVTARLAVYDGAQANDHGIPTDVGDSVLGFGEVEWEARKLKLGGWAHSDLAEGVYVVGERRLDRRIGAFARFSVSPDGPVALYADGGIRVFPALRRKDFAGLGYAVSRVTPEGGTAYTEQVVEVTYQALITGWMTVQPDVQLVVQPDRAVVIGAVRTTVVF